MPAQGIWVLLPPLDAVLCLQFRLYPDLKRIQTRALEITNQVDVVSAQSTLLTPSARGSPSPASALGPSPAARSSAVLRYCARQCIQAVAARGTALLPALSPPLHPMQGSPTPWGPEPALPSPQFFQPLGIRVALLAVEVWNQGNPIAVGPSARATLERFLQWRQTDLLPRLPHDNAQLLT